ncbi:hypothetical protein AB834_01020 [PVC group bacterium (ex Bugula neritina AB1)]|nr:hypothetical protein AB834_01020 [PVC group bacterium (ex Bugula neritina AB1)]
MIFSLCFVTLGSFDLRAEVLTIERALLVALDANFDIEVLNLELKKAEQSKNKEMAKYDPQISFGFNVLNSTPEESLYGLTPMNENLKQEASLSKKMHWGSLFKFSYMFDSNGYGNSNLDHYSSEWSVEMEQSLTRNFFGKTDKYRESVVQKKLDSLTWETQRRIVLVTQQVLNVFFEMYFYAHRVRNQKAIILVAKDFLKLNQDKMEYGIVEETDVLAARVNVELKQVDLRGYQNDFDKAFLKLKDLLNDKDITIDFLKEPLLKKVDKTLEQLQEQALKKRWDLKALVQEKKAAEFQVLLNEKDRQPALDFVASIKPLNREFHFRDTLKDALEAKHASFFAGIKMAHSWGSTFANASLKQSKVDVQKWATLESEKRQTISREVAIAYKNFQTAKDQGQSLQNVVNLQKKKMDQEIKKYKTGRSSAKVIIDYQDDLLRVQNLLLAKKFERQLAWVSLNISTNDLFEALDLDKTVAL